MVRQFDLPWQPVAKRKQRESFEEMSIQQRINHLHLQIIIKVLKTMKIRTSESVSQSELAPKGTPAG